MCLLGLHPTTNELISLLLHCPLAEPLMIHDIIDYVKDPHELEGSYDLLLNLGLERKLICEIMTYLLPSHSLPKIVISFWYQNGEWFSFNHSRSKISEEDFEKMRKSICY